MKIINYFVHCERFRSNNLKCNQKQQFDTTEDGASFQRNCSTVSTYEWKRQNLSSLLHENAQLFLREDRKIPSSMKKSNEIVHLLLRLNENVQIWVILHKNFQLVFHLHKKKTPTFSSVPFATIHFTEDRYCTTVVVNSTLYYDNNSAVRYCIFILLLHTCTQRREKSVLAALYIITADHTGVYSLYYYFTAIFS